MENYRGFWVKVDGARWQVRDMNKFHFGYYQNLEAAKFAIDGYWEWA